MISSGGVHRVAVALALGVANGPFDAFAAAAVVAIDNSASILL